MHPGLLVLLSDIVRDALLPEHELDLYRRNRKQALSQELTQPAAAADRILRRALFGDTGYGAAQSGPQAVDAIERQLLIDYHDAVLRPGDALLILTGKLPPRATLIQDVAVLFGGWPPGNPVREALSPRPEAKRRFLSSSVPGAELAEIRVGHEAPPFASAESLPLTLASMIWGANPRSRINAALQGTLSAGGTLFVPM